MATKKISDLQLRSDADATCQLPTDDASQTWRVTLAQIKTYILSAAAITYDMLNASAVHGNTADSTPAAVDEILTWDSSATALKKVTRSDFLRQATTPKTSNYTVTDEDDIIFVDASGGGFTITQQAVATRKRPVVIKRTDNTPANAVVIGTVDGASMSLYTKGETVRLVSDGSLYYCTNHKTTTDWTAFTPTGSWSANTTYTGLWRRVGDTAEIVVNIALAGAPTTASLTVNQMSGLTIDSAKVPAFANLLTIGRGEVLDAAVQSYAAQVSYSTTTVVSVQVFNSSATYATTASVTQAVPMTFGNADAVKLLYSVPIANWLA